MECSVSPVVWLAVSTAEYGTYNNCGKENFSIS